MKDGQIDGWMNKLSPSAQCSATKTVVAIKLKYLQRSISHQIIVTINGHNWIQSTHLYPLCQTNKDHLCGNIVYDQVFRGQT